MCCTYMDMDTKVKQRMDECNQLVALLEGDGMEVSDDFRRRCRKQLVYVVSKVWQDHATHMGRADARNAIWHVLSNGLHALRGSDVAAV